MESLYLLPYLFQLIRSKYVCMYVRGDRYDVSSVVWCGVGRRLIFDAGGLGGSR